jgi:hypothetical protein
VSRARNHAHAEEYQRRDIGVDGLALFEQPVDPATPPPAPPAPSPVTARPSDIRREKARRIREQRWRRWIDAGKPVALAVVRAAGKVTADTFRSEAEKHLGVLPPEYGEDRTGSYVSAMFAEMVREGTLQKRTRADGSVVKEYSANGNEHTVYVLAEGQR